MKRARTKGFEPLTHLWRFNRGWILDSRVEGNLAYAVAGIPLFSAVSRNLAPAMYTRPIWQLRAVIELAPSIYLIADYLDKTLRHYVRFHVAHQEVSLRENCVTAVFSKDCRLEILPLTDMKPPQLSLDRPVNHQKIPQEITTAVEYSGVSGPWSLFVLAALDSTGEIALSSQGEAISVERPGCQAQIQIDNHVLRVEEGRNAPALIDPLALLSKFRRESR